MVAKSFGIVAAKSHAGIRVGARNYGGFLGYLARFQEGGTKERFRTTSTGKKVSTGRIKPTNFWSKTVKQTSNKVGQQIEQELLNSLQKYMKKVINKYG